MSRLLLLLLSASPLALSLGGAALQDRYPHLSLSHDHDTDTIITLAGYKAETHKVKTSDDYMLTLHRIVGTGPVVFMQHGLEGSSADWVLAGPDHGAPGFRLAEQGYDVWLGNFRGNHYSREHKTLNPNTNNAYWQFSWDEMAKYDLPAELNYVLEETKKEKIYYVGHSMGTTTFLAMNSLDQSWADKVELAVLLAPVAYINHMKSPIRIIAPFSDLIEWVAIHMGIGEFLPSNYLMDLIVAAVCENNYLDVVCENIVFLLCGYDENQMNKTMVPTIATHLPAGTSSFAVLQYAQGVKHKRFGGLDWGNDKKNLAHHGSKTPPLYNLKDVNTRLALFWGDNDWLAAEKDVSKIINEVGHLAVNNKIPYHGWNHFDFLFAIDIDKYQNNDLISVLGMYPID